MENSGEPKEYTPEFKTKAVLESIKASRTLEEVADEFGIEPSLLAGWRDKVLNDLPLLFNRKKTGKGKDKQDAEVAKLTKQLEKEKAEIEWLKSKINGH